MYGKNHVALNKVNVSIEIESHKNLQPSKTNFTLFQSYEKQSFHSGTPPPFNMANTQTAGGTSAQPYGMYLPMPAAGHHNMIHQPIHQVEYNLEHQQFDISQEQQQQNEQVAAEYDHEQMWRYQTNNHHHHHNHNNYASVEIPVDSTTSTSEHNLQENLNYVQEDISDISFFAE